MKLRNSLRLLKALRPHRLPKQACCRIWNPTCERLKTIIPVSLLFFVFVFNCNSQSESLNLKLRMLTPQSVGEVNFNKGDFLEYAKAFTNKIKSELAGDSIKRDVLILLTLHKNKVPSIQIFARPGFKKAESDKLLATLKSVKEIRSKIMDFSLLFEIPLNGGSGGEQPYTPSYISPMGKKKKDFQQADLKTKYQLIKEWSINEVIPLLAAMETKVDKKFAGVIGVGEILKNTDFSKPINVSKLIDENTNFWRAVMEMNSGNQLIPVSKIFMLASQGKFNRAVLYLNVIKRFSDPKCLASYLADELRWRAKAFDDEVYRIIQKGIVLHDKGKYDQAIKVYQNLLKIFPDSAWANYELYFSKNSQLLLEGKNKSLNPDEKNMGNWRVAAKIIYECNPMYPMMAQASSGKEGYILIRRMQLKELFKKKKDFKKDILQYADIAMDLDAYALAAQIYYLMVTCVEEKRQKEILTNFLYCLDKLGEKKLKRNFKGNFEEEFKRIDIDRNKRMNDCKSFKAFKKKE